MDVRTRLEEVKARIARAASACGRDPASVTLIAVSKTKPAALIREAYAAGQRAFGENYAQELAEKRAELHDIGDIDWHFIGHLQTNKVKVVVPAAIDSWARVAAVHTVDSVRLAKELGKRVRAGARGWGEPGGGPLDVLVEVNVGGEPQKFGVAAGDLEEILQAIEAEEGLRLRGLMTVPPAEGREVAKRVFDTLATLRSVHGGAIRLPELSMGMTADLEEAVASGATMVRVGSAIFGER